MNDWVAMATKAPDPLSVVIIWDVVRTSKVFWNGVRFTRTNDGSLVDYPVSHWRPLRPSEGAPGLKVAP